MAASGDGGRQAQLPTETGTEPVVKRVERGDIGIRVVLERYARGALSDEHLRACAERGVLSHQHVRQVLYGDKHLVETRQECYEWIRSLGTVHTNLSPIGAGGRSDQCKFDEGRTPIVENADGEREFYCLLCHKRVTVSTDGQREFGHHRLESFERHGLEWQGCPFRRQWGSVWGRAGESVDGWDSVVVVEEAIGDD